MVLAGVYASVHITCSSQGDLAHSHMGQPSASLARPN